MRSGCRAPFHAANDEKCTTAINEGILEGEDDVFNEREEMTDYIIGSKEEESVVHLNSRSKHKTFVDKMEDLRGYKNNTDTQKCHIQMTDTLFIGVHS
jgi:hypothetical protein